MAKTKASKLWLSMVIVFVVLLSVSYAEAKSLKKGEEYKDKSGEAIRVVSSDEVEIERGPDILLGKYTVDGERVRIVANVFGATLVIYYKITPDGLVEEKTGKIYYSKAGLAAMNVQEEVEEALKCQCGCGSVLKHCSLNRNQYCKNCGFAIPGREYIAGLVKEGKNKDEIINIFVKLYGEKVLK